VHSKVDLNSTKKIVLTVVYPVALVRREEALHARLAEVEVAKEVVQAVDHRVRQVEPARPQNPLLNF
jgi:hypothetical protein